MSREWMPGDVAIAPWPEVRSGEHDFSEQRIVRYGSGWALASDPDDFLNDGHKFSPVKTARPLVVIDPEDREQVERLHTLWCQAIVSKGTSARQIDSMQSALREFANPTPRIEEPKGLGAVVKAVCECGTGEHLFIHDPLSPRFEGRPCSPGKTWKAPCGHHEWSNLTSVRVLSEGWSE